MSGAFEAAAGAFAVVGVVDVLIRTGREIFSFLSDIKDAPNNITRLTDSINDTVQLAQASKACLDSLHNSAAPLPKTGATLVLDSAIKALNRELQGLKSLTVKFKGNKTWGRVKYVLNDAKIDKATRYLETHKSLLSSALTLACSELSTRGRTEIELLVRQCLHQVEYRITQVSGAISTNLDDQSRTMNAHYYGILAIHTNEQQKILTTLNAQSNTQSREGAARQRQIMTRLSCASHEVIAQQKQLRHLAKQNLHQGSSLTARVALAAQNSTYQHSQTEASIATLTSEIKQLKVSLGLEPMHSIYGNHTHQHRGQQDRGILFFGEHSEMIMAYLLPLQFDLESTLERLVNDHSHEISVAHVHWLQSEFRRLIASAAQESAGRFQGSTASSIDQWSYVTKSNQGSGILPEVSGKVHSSLEPPRKLYSAKRKAPSILSGESSKVRRSGAPDRVQLQKKRAVAPRAYSRNSNHTWSMETPSGHIHFSLPPPDFAHSQPRVADEVGLSCMVTQNRSTFAVNAQFRRVPGQTSEPEVQTRLSVFNTVENMSEVYRHLFGKGSISAIDFAYRDGTISPFHVDGTGSNYYFQTAIEKVVPEALDYLGDQGIRAGLIMHGLDEEKARKGLEAFLLYTEKAVTVNPKVHTLLEHINEEVAQSSSIFANVALTLSIQAYARRDWCDAGPLFSTCLRMIQTKRDEPVPSGWLRVEDMLPMELWETVPPRKLLSFLSVAGADIPKLNVFYSRGNALSYFMFHRLRREDQNFFWADVNFLTALIDFGVDIRGKGQGFFTPSQEARLDDCWEEWCAALERHGESIADIVEAEGQFWIWKDGDWQLRDDRSEVDCLGGVIKKRSAGTGYYYTDDSESDTSDVESDWSDRSCSEPQRNISTDRSEGKIRRKDRRLT